MIDDNILLRDEDHLQLDALITFHKNTIILSVDEDYSSTFSENGRVFEKQYKELINSNSILTKENGQDVKLNEVILLKVGSPSSVCTTDEKS